MNAHKIALSFFFIFLIVPLSYAHAKTPENIQAEYDALVQESYDMPEGYDFAKLRDLYKKLPSYSPYTQHPVMNYRAYKKAREESPEKDKELADFYIKAHFALPEAHMYGIGIANRWKDQVKEDYHTWMFRGLYKALIDTGTGESPEKAFKVLNVSEEYYVLEPVMEKKGRTQTLRKENGRIYDLITGKDSETGKKIDYWFDITDVFGKGI